MSWPLSQDFNEAIQNPASSFNDPDLKMGEIALSPLGLPVPRSGNFADVYQMNAKDGRKWAVKCFTRKVAGLQERYAKIDQHLSKVQLPFTVGFQYLPEGIRVRGQWYPIVKMEWVEGFTLNEFVRQNTNKPAYLHALIQMWGKLTARLRDAHLAHADLQHGNVLLVPGATPNKLGLKLIDYDGMWIPSLSEKHSGEIGHPNYQHPLRLEKKLYSPEVDRFPHLVIAASLRATLIGGKALWDQFDNGDNLLFKESDLKNISTAPVFKTLWGLRDKPLCALLGHLVLAAQQPLVKTPWLDEILFHPSGPQLTSEQETKVGQLLGVSPTTRTQVAGNAPIVEEEFNVFAELDFFGDDSEKNHSSKSASKRPRYQPETAKLNYPLIIGGGILAFGLLILLIASLAGKKKPISEVVQNNNTEEKKDPPLEEETKEGIEKKEEPKKTIEEKKEPKVLFKENPRQVAVPRSGTIQFDAPKIVDRYKGDPIRFLEYTPDGKVLMAASRKTVYILDGNDFSELRKFDHGYGAEGKLNPLIVLGANSALYICGFGGDRISTWNWETGVKLRDWTLPAKTQSLGMALTTDKQKLILRQNNGFSLWDLKLGTIIDTIQTNTPLGGSSGRGVPVSWDGKSVIVQSENDYVIRHFGDSQFNQKLQGFSKNDYVYLGFQFGMDDRSIAAVAMPSKQARDSGTKPTIYLWDAQTGEKLFSEERTRGLTPAWFLTPDNLFLIGELGATLLVLDPVKKQIVSSIPNMGREGVVTFTPDSDASIGADAFGNLLIRKMIRSVGNVAVEPKELPKENAVLRLIGSFPRRGMLGKFDGSPNQKVIGLVAPLGEVTIIDPIEMKEQKSFKIPLEPQERILHSGFADDSMVICRDKQGQDQLIEIWDWKQEKKLFQVDSPAPNLRAIGLLILNNSQGLIVRQQNSLLVDLKSGKVGLPMTPLGPMAIRGTWKILGSDDLLVQSTGGKTILWNPFENQLKKELLDRGNYFSPRISPNGKYLVTLTLSGQQQQISIWTIESRTTIHETIECPSTVGREIFFSADSNYLAINYPNLREIHLYSVPEKKIIGKIPFPRGTVIESFLLPDSDRVAILDARSELSFWQFGTPPKVVMTPKETPKKETPPNPSGGFLKASANLDGRVVDLAHTLDGKKLVVGTARGKIHILHPETLAEINSFQAVEGTLNDLMVLPKSSPTAKSGIDFLATIGSDKKIRVWDLEKGTSIKDIASEKFFSNIGGHRIFAIENTRVIMATEDSRFRAWDYMTGKEVPAKLPKFGKLRDLTFSSDGKYGFAFAEDRKLTIFNSGNLQARTMDAVGDIRNIRHSGESKLIVATEGDFLRVYDYTKGKEIHRLEGHRGAIHDVAIVPGFSRAISISHAQSDRTIRVWDLKTGTEIAKWSTTRYPRKVTVSPDGKYALIGDGLSENQVSLWALPTVASSEKK